MTRLDKRTAIFPQALGCDIIYALMGLMSIPPQAVSNTVGHGHNVVDLITCPQHHISSGDV